MQHKLFTPIATNDSTFTRNKREREATNSSTFLPKKTQKTSEADYKTYNIGKGDYITSSQDLLAVKKLTYKLSQQRSNQVMYCKDINTGKTCILRKYSGIDPNDSKTLKDIENEIYIASILGNFIAATNNINIDGNYYIVMNYIPGNNLEYVLEKLNKQKNSDEVFYEKLNIAILIVQALLRLHQHRILHHDITLKNIIFDDKTKSIQFIDYELSFLAQDNLSIRTWDFTYILPEVSNINDEGFLYTNKSDIYLLGHMLQEWFDNMPESQETSEVVKRVNSLLEKMREDKPEDRVNLHEALMELTELNVLKEMVQKSDCSDSSTHSTQKPQLL